MVELDITKAIEELKNGTASRMEQVVCGYILEAFMKRDDKCAHTPIRD